MYDFFLQMKSRNESLFYFGWICFLFSVVCLIAARFSSVQVYQVNAWFKPFKFAFSTCTLVWAMAWFMHYLPSFKTGWFNWTMILLLTFEIAYIAIMAAQGKKSHFNTSTPLYATLYGLMALAASLVTICVAIVGYHFFTQSFPSLPLYYVWAIRLGILLFVIFSFSGFSMGARMSHSVGLDNDNSNLFILGWSKLTGDLRVAHFIGMHALQLLPLLAFYALKNTKLTLAVGIIYGIFTIATFVQALLGKPFFK